ncbi:MAG: prepilin peptidase, partial [Deltaproteobacteria bacterium]
MARVTLPDLLLLVVLGIALVTDLKDRKIYDWTTLPAIGVGVLLAAGRAAYHEKWGILLDSLLGGGVAFVIFLILGLLGGMKGGDIKMMTAIGAIEGVTFLLPALVYIFLAGGIFALGHLLVTGKFRPYLRYLTFPLLRPLFPRLARAEKPAPTWLPYG